MAPSVTRMKVKKVNANDTNPTIDEAVLIFEPMNAALCCAFLAVHLDKKVTHWSFQSLTSSRHHTTP